MPDELRLWCDVGLLTWDGRILELFPNTGKDSAWRVHAATVVRWELEPRKNVSLLKVWTSAKHYEAALVTDADESMMRHIMAEVDTVA